MRKDKYQLLGTANEAFVSVPYLKNKTNNKTYHVKFVSRDITKILYERKYLGERKRKELY